MSLSPVQAQRNRVASLSRFRGPESVEVEDARRDLNAAKLEQYIIKVVATAPPLTDNQRAHLASLLREGAPATGSRDAQ